MVLDTNVIVAGMRSPGGASAELLRRARRGVFIPLAIVALAIEYQDVCLRDEHVRGSGLTSAQVREPFAKPPNP